MRDTDAWDDLIEALIILKRGANDSISPLHCEHDELWLMADPEVFSYEELSRLDELGVFVSDGGFKSYRFGSA